MTSHDARESGLWRFKPYPEYKDSGVEWIGRIPTHWGTEPLFTIARERKERNAGNQVENVLSLSYGKIVQRDVATNFGLLPESFDTYQLVEPGNIVLRLTDLQNDKRSLRVGLVDELGVITSAYLGLDLYRQLTPSYGFYLLHAYDVTKVFYALGAGVRQTMKFDDLKWMPILVPEADEQRAIAAFLDQETATIDALVAKKERLIELLQEKRTTLITWAVTKGLDPNVPMKDSGVEWLGEIPAHWNLRRLRATVKACQNGVWGEEPSGRNDMPCVRVADFDRVTFRVDTTDLTLRSIEKRDAQARTLEAGDLLLEKSGGGEKQPVGAVVLYDHDLVAVCSNFIARMPVADGFSPRFLAYLHAALYAARISVRSIKQSTGIQNLDSGSYLSEHAGFPEFQEQCAIAAFLDQETATIDALVAKVRDAINRLKELRTALISAAVTGRIDVRGHAA